MLHRRYLPSSQHPSSPVDREACSHVLTQKLSDSGHRRTPHSDLRGRRFGVRVEASAERREPLCFRGLGVLATVRRIRVRRDPTAPSDGKQCAIAHGPVLWRSPRGAQECSWRRVAEYFECGACAASCDLAFLASYPCFCRLLSQGDTGSQSFLRLLPLQSFPLQLCKLVDHFLVPRLDAGPGVLLGQGQRGMWA